MERVVNRLGARSRTRPVTILPAADGWRVSGIVDGESPRPVGSMQEAAALLPEGTEVSLSVPVSSVLMERMTLPATNPEELDGMVLLQLEKTLPYSGEELTSGFHVIRQEGSESELLAIAVSNEQLNTLCEPLRARRHLPARVGVFAIQLAARFPDEEVLGMIFREAGSTILCVARNGSLVAAHACATVEREAFITELPRLLLAAELEGTPVNFTRVVVESELASWIEAMREHLGDVRLERFSPDAAVGPCSVNLVPAGWTEEKRQFAQKAKIQEWLLLGGGVYLFLLLLAAGYIIWLEHQVSAVNAQVAAAAPAVDSIATRKARWEALAPATDPSRYVVELLNQVSHSIPSDDLHVTILHQASPSEFSVEGEAPTAAIANLYGDALKNDPDLKIFHFDTPLPEILPNDHAHFVFYGKL